jgi:hypothetical protein
MENKKKCTKCLEYLSFDLFYKDKGTISGLGSRCKRCVKLCSRESQEKNKDFRKEYLKEYEKNNKDKILEKRRVYVQKNKEYFREYNKKYNVNKRKEDVIFRLKHNVRNRMWCAFTKKQWKKEGSEKLLGEKYEIVISHIESLFKEGMNWDNWGRYYTKELNTNVWHIDHIIPLNTAKNKEELELLCNYKNLQPLWAFENLSKPKKQHYGNK